MIHIYTGNGKGKTTSAIGQAVRALGHKYKVIMIQFMKGDPNYGEIKTLKKIRNIKVVQSGLPTFVEKGKPSKEDLKLAAKGFALAKKALKEKKYQMVILDEINVAVDYGLLQLADVIKLAENCPKNIELILTGRYASKELIDIADLVSEIKEIKHPYQKGFVSRKGIDY
ncbi:MAG: cob(I)yrinic acid a,c-diamide adenosyltransferase [Candidatus Latescibacteria bacterium]|nr:cob(I)yrinic acid a,c-diamide adenosyltransferase [Candidatus Latescibacterota bacterium]